MQRSGSLFGTVSHAVSWTSFPLFVCFVLLKCVGFCFLLFYFALLLSPLEAWLFFNESQETEWFGEGEEVGRTWEE